MMPPHSQPSNYSRNAHQWCAVVRKPGNAWLDSICTPAIDTWNRSCVCRLAMDGKFYALSVFPPKFEIMVTQSL